MTDFKYGTRWAIHRKFCLKEREVAIKQAFEYIRDNRMKGDWLEFGTYSGNTLTMAMFFRKRFKMENRILAFDSFEGFITEDKFFKKGEYKTTIEEMYQIIRKNALDGEQIEFIQTDFKEIKSKPPKSISGVYLDCDRYDLAIPILEFIKGNLETGAVILFDDWFLYKAVGVRKAFLEFCKRNKKMEFESFGEFGMGKGFILVKGGK